MSLMIIPAGLRADLSRSRPTVNRGTSPTVSGEHLQDFALDPRLSADSLPVADLPLSAVRLMRDANYPWLLSTPLDLSDITSRMKALRKVGVPYSLSQAEYDANVTKFDETVARQLHIPDAQKNLIEQANFGNYDGDRTGISEMDALVAYLQVLGTMVDFSKYTDDAFVEFR